MKTRKVSEPPVRQEENKFAEVDAVAAMLKELGFVTTTHTSPPDTLSKDLSPQCGQSRIPRSSK